MLDCHYEVKLDKCSLEIGIKYIISLKNHFDFILRSIVFVMYT